MKCRPGDLALIVGGLSENIGRFVTVEHRPAPGELLHTVANHNGGPHRIRAHPDADWIVRSEHGTLVVKVRHTSLYFQSPVSAMRDRHLRPIRPGDPDEITETNQPIEIST